MPEVVAPSTTAAAVVAPSAEGEAVKLPPKTETVSGETVDSESSNDDVYTLYYWFALEKFFGRCIGVVLALDHVGAKWQALDKEAAPGGVGLAAPWVTIPANKAADGPDAQPYTLTQTTAILIEIASRTAPDVLLGKTSAEKAYCLQSLMDVEDITNESFSGKFQASEEKKRTQEDGLNRLMKWCTVIEDRLSKRTWLAGESGPTIADFHGIFSFEWVQQKALKEHGLLGLCCAGAEGSEASEKSLMKMYPSIARWWAAVNSVPAVKKMRSHPTTKLIPA